MTDAQSAATEKLWDGTRLSQTGDLNAALDALTEAINLQPNLIRAYKERADAYRRLGMDYESGVDERKALELTRRSQRASGYRQSVVRASIGQSDGGMFSFDGQIGRRTYLEYWVVTVILIGAAWFFALLLGIFGGPAAVIGTLLILVAAVGAVWIGLASAAKRFRDLEQSGGLAILTLIPFLGILVWVILLASPGKLSQD